MNFVKRSWGETHSEVFGYKFLFVKKQSFCFEVLLQQRDNYMR